MAEPQEKVSYIDESAVKENTLSQMSAKKEKGWNDMGKAALIISLLSLVLLVIFFFGLSRNLAGLTAEVKQLNSLRQEVEGIETRLVEVEKMPLRARNMIIDSELDSMAQRAAYLGGLVDSERGEKLVKAQELLREVQYGLEK